MKIKMLRTLGRSKRDVEEGVDERLEGQVYDVDEKEGKALLEAKLAEEVKEGPLHGPRRGPVPAPVSAPAKPGEAK